jgi:ketosteroid isomerase-like protein
MKVHPNEDAEPRGLFDSDPDAVREIIALERELEEMYNTVFITDPGSPLVLYEESDDLWWFDLFAPGEYRGEEVRKFYNWMGPQYVGRLDFKEIKVFAKGDAGFVVMKQRYTATDQDGNRVEMMMRQTDGVLKHDGKWKVAHTHISFPIRHEDMTADITSYPLPLPWDRESAPA